MSSQDTDYYRLRADEDRQAARLAPTDYIAEIHLQLACAYEGLLQDNVHAVPKANLEPSVAPAP